MQVPPPLGIGTVKLEDGSSVKGFICEGWVAGARQKPAVDAAAWCRRMRFVPSAQRACICIYAAHAACFLPMPLQMHVRLELAT